MSNTIVLTGNVGKNPSLEKTDRANVVRFSMLCDEWKRVDDPDNPGKKTITSDTDKQEWYQISVWKESLSEAVMKTIQKGARITVEGHLTVGRWEKDGVPQFALQITADNILHNLNRVDEVRLRERRVEPSDA